MTKLLRTLIFPEISLGAEHVNIGSLTTDDAPNPASVGYSLKPR